MENKTELKTYHGYFVNEDHTAITSMHSIIQSVEKPQHFIESENMDTKVLRIVDNGTRIEVASDDKIKAKRAFVRKKEIEK